MIKYVPLGEVCEILNGYAFESENYVDSGARVIRITNVQKGRIVDSNPKFYPLSGEYSSYALREGDVLMSLTGNVGRVGFLEKDLLPTYLNQRVACLRVVAPDVLLKYIYYCLNNDHFETDCISASRGIAQKNMSTKWLADYFVPIADMSTQRIIVGFFDRLSQLIADRQNQLAKIDLMVKSRFVTTDFQWQEVVA
ncbi:MAG: restriction endonuclease subunit S [Lachnospiraceae bacterium]|jgi:type I restriction enzyme S subunit|nr:restriction endonuclease subunit S [Lachnospiraceae bacterium]